MKVVNHLSCNWSTVIDLEAGQVFFFTDKPNVFYMITDEETYISLLDGMVLHMDAGNVIKEVTCVSATVTITNMEVVKYEK